MITDRLLEILTGQAYRLSWHVPPGDVRTPGVWLPWVAYRQALEELAYLKSLEQLGRPPWRADPECRGAVAPEPRRSYQTSPREPQEAMQCTLPF